MPGNYAVGDVLGLIVAEVLEVLLVDIPFTVLSDDLHVLEVQSHFGFVLEDFANEELTFVLAPKE